jgi:hypothetical protein
MDKEVDRAMFKCGGYILTPLLVKSLSQFFNKRKNFEESSDIYDKNILDF